MEIMLTVSTSFLLHYSSICSFCPFKLFDCLFFFYYSYYLKKSEQSWSLSTDPVKEVKVDIDGEKPLAEKILKS